ncbi:MAG: Atxe2 family lasso peptide isopeptidase, partial [Sphingomonas sp.]
MKRGGIAAFAVLLLGTTAVAQATPVCRERLLPPPRAATGQGALSAGDLVELRDFGASSVSPDGRWAAMILRRADAAHDGYCFGVIVVPLAGGAPRLVDIGGEPILLRSDLRGVSDVVNGTIDETGPVWSPDGRSIAYLRRDRGVTQVWVATVGGRARQLTDLADDARGVEWASAKALRVRVRPSLSAQAEITAEGRSGFLYDRRFWAISEARPSPVPRPFETLTLDAATGKRVPEVPAAKDADRPANAGLFVRLPGGGIAWTAPEAPARYAGPFVLTAELRGRRLTCGEPCASRTTGLWVSGPGEILFLRGGSTENGGRTDLYRWRLDRETEPHRVLATADALFGCGLAGRRLICGHETARHPRTLVAIDPDVGTMTTLYDPNPDLSGLIRGPVERLQWTADGVPSYGDLVLPPDHKPGQRHPLIVVQYISHGFLRGGVGDEYPIHLFAARGYAVLSISRPPPPSRESDASDVDSMQRVNVTGWADRRRVLASLEAGIDTVLARGVADPERIGLTGLSDGSSTVQFALLNSDRFRAAAISTCCESAGVLATVGLAYSDYTTKCGYPAPGFDDPGFWKPYSLAANAEEMRVPLLIQVADREYRLALETFAALDHAQAPVEMYVFPDEYH